MECADLATEENHRPALEVWRGGFIRHLANRDGMKLIPKVIPAIRAQPLRGFHQGQERKHR